MLRGECFRQRSWERRISVIESGLWPTPTANNYKEGKFGRNVRSLAREAVFGKGARPIPTPTAATCRRTRTSKKSRIVHKSSNTLTDYVIQLTGRQEARLNPRFDEWLMGWPLGWTRLEPLETDKYRVWLEQHGDC